jgi:hypothetical protein
LHSLPGAKQTYSAWRELADQLKAMLAPFRRVAMRYSPNSLIFYVGMVDAEPWKWFEISVTKS